MSTPKDSAKKEGGQKPGQQKPGQLEQLLSSRLLIFVLIFAVTGFLGLPILWMSPSFSRFEKYFWSVVNILYTSILMAICVAICFWAWNRITGSS